jgi:hypothetical protein
VPELHSSGGSTPGPERQLNEPERRKLRIWSAIVKSAMALSWLCLAAELALFLWPAAPRILRVVTGAVLVESFLTAVLVGAFGKCPACNANFGLESRRLLPERCRSCGAALSA